MTEENRLYEATLRFPTKEYAFIELKVSDTLEGILSVSRGFQNMIVGGEGLQPREWNKVLDTYREGSGISEETLSKLNKAQMWLIHEIDKSDQRLNN